MAKRVPLFFIFVAAAALPWSLHAKEAVARSIAMMGNCEMKENVGINVNFNFKAKSFQEAKARFDEQLVKVNEYAKQQQLKKFDLQSQSYNIYAQPVGYNPDDTPDTYTFQVTGNSNYQMDDADAAFKFAEFLVAQKLQVGFNSNSHRQGNCN